MVRATRSCQRGQSDRLPCGPGLLCLAALQRWAIGEPFWLGATAIGTTTWPQGGKLTMSHRKRERPYWNLSKHENSRTLKWKHTEKQFELCLYPLPMCHIPINSLDSQSGNWWIFSCQACCFFGWRFPSNRTQDVQSLRMSQWFFGATMTPPAWTWPLAQLAGGLLGIRTVWGTERCPRTELVGSLGGLEESMWKSSRGCPS